MDALTVRGPQDKDTIKPENGKSETEDGNSKSRSRRNLSKDRDGGSDPKTDTVKLEDGKSENGKS